MSHKSAVQTRHRIFFVAVGHKGVPDAVNVFCGVVNFAGSFSLLIMLYRSPFVH